MNEQGVINEENKVEEDIWIEDLGSDGLDNQDIGDRIITALDVFCGIPDVKCLYIKKEGNHLAVGRTEINCIE